MFDTEAPADTEDQRPASPARLDAESAAADLVDGVGAAYDALAARPASGPADKEPREPDGQDEQEAPTGAKPVAAAGAALPDAPEGSPEASAAEVARATQKPPADWRASARAEWAKLPRAVQIEAHRLHVETKKTLQESADARREAASWREAVAPHQALFQAEGITPAQGFAALAGAYSRLQSGPLEERVQIVGNLIRQFVGTDDASINALAAALEGAPAQAQRSAAPAPAGPSPEQLEAVAHERAHAVVVEQARRDAQADWGAFEATRPEFLNQVRREMQATVSVMGQENPGRRFTPDDYRRAYEQAVRMNPQTAAILEQRKVSAAASRRAAAAGMRSEPAGSARPSTPKTLRDQVAAAYDQLSSGSP